MDNADLDNALSELLDAGMIFSVLGLDGEIVYVAYKYIPQMVTNGEIVAIEQPFPVQYRRV